MTGLGGWGSPWLVSIKMRKGMLVIGASMHLQEYKFWDLLFANHPNGNLYQWAREGKDGAEDWTSPRGH